MEAKNVPRGMLYRDREWQARAGSKDRRVSACVRSLLVASRGCG